MARGHCININTDEFRKLVEETGLGQREVKARIAVWQNRAGKELDEFPTSQEVLNLGKKGSGLGNFHIEDEFRKTLRRSIEDRSDRTTLEKTIQNSRKRGTDTLQSLQNYNNSPEDLTAKQHFDSLDSFMQDVLGTKQSNRMKRRYSLDTIADMWEVSKGEGITSVPNDVKHSLDRMNTVERLLNSPAGALAYTQSLAEIPEREGLIMGPYSRSNWRIRKVYAPQDITELTTSFREAFSQVVDWYQENDPRFTDSSRQEIIREVTPAEISNDVRDGFQAKLEELQANGDVTHASNMKKALDNFEDIMRLSESSINDFEGVRFKYNDVKTYDYVSQEDMDGGNSRESDIDDYISFGEERDKEGWMDNAQFTSVAQSLTPLIKRKLSIIPQFSNPDDPNSYNILGYRKMMSGETIKNDLLRNLKDLAYSRDFTSRLEKMATTRPWVTEVLNEMSKDANFRSQLYQALRKDRVSMGVVKSTVNSDGTYTHETVNINRSENARNIVDNWRAGIEARLVRNINSSAYNADGTFNKEHITSNINDINELIGKWRMASRGSLQDRRDFIDDNYVDIAKQLHAIGIDISYEDTKDLFDDVENTQNKTGSDISYNIDKVLDTLKYQNAWNSKHISLKGESMIDENSGNFLKIANIINEKQDELIEDSVTENGKTYSSYQQPSWLSRYTKLLNSEALTPQQYRDFIQDEFGQFIGTIARTDGQFNIAWLNKLVNDPGARRVFQLKREINFNKIGPSKWSDLNILNTLLSEYFMDGKGLSNDTAYYHVPIMSDSMNYSFLKFYKYTDDFRNNVANDLLKTFDYEWNRIKLVEARKGIPDVKDIDNFDKLGDKFVHLKFLNNYRDEINRLEEEAKRTGNNTELYSKVKDMIISHLESESDKAIESMKELGLLSRTDNTNAKSDFIYLKGYGMNSDNYREKLKEYFFNSYNATTNIIQLTSGDLAYYKNTLLFQKRNKEKGSPGVNLDVYAKYQSPEDKIAGREGTSMFVTRPRLDKDGVKRGGGEFSDRERFIIIKDAEEPSDKITIKGIKDALDRNPALSEDEKAQILSGIGDFTPDATSKDGTRYKRVGDRLYKTSDNNLTDGQALRSVNGYRKVLSGSGKLSPEVKESLNRLEGKEKDDKGNPIYWTWKDYNTIMTIIKPFVYAQTARDSKVPVEGGEGNIPLKVGIQRKNSESLLPAIMGLERFGGEEPSYQLQALYQIMEDNDLDSIQFDSAIKDGGQGALDLSGFTNKKDIVDFVNKQIQDNQVLHEISYEDYRIQQPTPESLFEHESAIGTPLRKIVLGDISNDAVFNIGKKKYSKEEIIKNSNNVIIEKAFRSYNEVKNLFGDDESLQHAIENELTTNSRYVSDLINSIQMESVKGADGKVYKRYILPLYDPAQGPRVMSLLNSIWKNRVNKQMTDGGKAVQLSSYGISKSLRLEFNSDGGISHMEAYMPFWKDLTEEQQKHFEDPVTKILDLQKMLREGFITKDALQAVAYRVPTEDKYSIIPIEVKGFLPRSMGGNIILPPEVTWLTGSDFDIDKMFIMFKHLNDIKDSPDGPTKRYEVEKYNEEDDVKDYTPKQLDNYYHDIVWSILTNPDTAPKMVNPGNFRNFSDIAKRLSILKSHPEKTLEEVQKMSSDDVTKLFDTEQYDIANPLTQVSLHKLNSAAVQLKGIVVNYNQAHSVMQNLHVGANGEGNYILPIVSGTKEAPVYNDRFVLNGKFLSTLGALYNGDKSNLVSKQLASILAAVLDTAKDPVASYYNMNANNANSVLGLFLLGYTPTEVGLFMNQPVIEDYIKNVDMAIANKKTKTEALQNTITQYATLNHDVLNNESIWFDAQLLRNRDFTSLYLGNVKNSKVLEKNRPQFNNNDLARMISLGSRIKRGEKLPQNDLQEFYKFQYQALLNYSQILEVGDHLSTWVNSLKADSMNGANGPDIATTQSKLDRIQESIDNSGKVIANTDAIKLGLLDENPSEEKAREILRDAPLGFVQGFTTMGLEGSQKALARLFPQAQTPIKEATDIIKNLTSSGRLSVKQRNNISNEFMAYYMSQFEGFKSAESRDLIENFANRFEEWKSNNPQVQDMELVKHIQFNKANSQNPFNHLSFNGGGRLIPSKTEQVMRDWESLSFGNDESREIARDLERYFYRVNGFNFGAKTPLHLCPTFVKLDIPGYADNIHKLNDYNEVVPKDENPIGSVGHYFMQSDMEYFADQYVRNHLGDTTLTKRIDSIPDKAFINEDKSPKDSIVITLDPYANKELYGNNKYFSKTIGKDTYYYKGDYDKDANTLTLIKINPLGAKNNYLEYDFGNPMLESKIKAEDYQKVADRASEEFDNYYQNPMVSYDVDMDDYDPSIIPEDIGEMPQERMFQPRPKGRGEDYWKSVEQELEGSLKQQPKEEKEISKTNEETPMGFESNGLDQLAKDDFGVSGKELEDRMKECGFGWL